MTKHDPDEPSELSEKDEEKDEAKTYFRYEEEEIEDKKLLKLSRDSDSASEFRKMVESLAKIDNNDAIAYLIANGYTLDIVNDLNQTPLHLAFRYESHHTLFVDKIFFKFEKDINYTDFAGLSHLHMASSTGNLDAIKHFLQNGADVNMQCSSDSEFPSYTPLHFASSAGKLDAVKHFLQNGADVNMRCDSDSEFPNYTPLHFAIKHRQLEVIEYLLNHGADVRSTGYSGPTLFHLACTLTECCGCDFTRTYITEARKQIDPNYETNYENVELAMMKMLISHGSPINTQDHVGATPVHAIFESQFYGRLDSLSSFTRSSSNTNNIFNLIRRNQKEKLQYLLDKGADVTIADKNGDTPLHWAVKNLKFSRQPSRHFSNICFDDHKIVEMIELLLTNGANVNAVNDEKKTPLNYAISALSSAVVKILLKYGALVDELEFPDGLYFYHIKSLYPTLEAVDNLIEIIEILRKEGFNLSLADNISVLEFFMYKADEYDDEHQCHDNYCDVTIDNYLFYGRREAVKIGLKDKITLNEVGAELELWLYRHFHFSTYINEVLKEIEHDLPLEPTEHNINDNFRDDLERELKFMEESLLSQNITISAVLKLSPSECYRYFKGGQYRKILQRKEYQDLDYYRHLVDGHFTKSLIRLYLRKSSDDYLRVMCPRLPELCHPMILEQLDMEDLYNMCFAVAGPS